MTVHEIDNTASPRAFPLAELLRDGASHRVVCHGPLMMDLRQSMIPASAPNVFSVVEGLGGTRGWLYADALWRLRGMMDAAIGGAGWRGRHDHRRLQVGDVVDFWRVELLEPERLIRFRGEFKVPGRAWLEFQFSPQDPQNTLLRIAAVLEPSGLAGRLYWYCTYPAHLLVLGGLQRAIASEATDTSA